MSAGDAAALARLEARVEKLTQALLHVAGELWVARDRQTVLERVLSEGGGDLRARVDAFSPDASLAAALAAEREAFIARVVGYLAPDA